MAFLLRSTFNSIRISIVGIMLMEITKSKDSNYEVLRPARVSARAQAVIRDAASPSRVAQPECVTNSP